MLTANWQRLYERLDRFQDALRKNHVDSFRKETTDKRDFRIGCVNRAKFTIQTFLIPAANSGRSCTPDNLTRLDSTMTEIYNSGFFEWSADA